MPLPKPPLREVVTIDGTNVELAVNANPVENLGVLKAKELFHYLNIFDSKFQPSNYNKADGSPLRLFDSAPVKIDVSKRSKEDMGFWHRNVDYHEVIICVRGALRWETEMGTVVLREGEVIVIPKGITHRSMLCEESAEENVLIELKCRDKLNYVGDNK
jgi:oxalate decarboxylase/phosphoglucose isomerase-like protein (cupin superfamily)